MKRIKVSEEKVKVLSEAVSEYVDNLGDNAWIEGLFVLPCGIDRVDSLILGVVYNNWRMGQRIQRSNKNRLYFSSVGLGIDVCVKEIDVNKFLYNLEDEKTDKQIMEMIKGSQIIYDANGNLELLQREFNGDESLNNLSNKGAVKMEPAIQYKKVRNLV